MSQQYVTFDASLLHPKAAEAIDREGLKLLECLTIRDLAIRGPSSFHSQKPVGPTISGTDIIGDIDMSLTDWSGRTTGRYFVHEQKEILLIEEDYLELRKTVEIVRKKKPFDFGLSEEFLEKSVFTWVKQRYLGEIEKSLSSELIHKSSTAIQDYDILIPFSCWEIEKEFVLGDCFITIIRENHFEKYSKAANKRTGSEKVKMLESLKQMRKKYEGCPALQLSIKAEKNFAKDYVMRKAFDVASVVRLLSPSAVSSIVGFPCFPIGHEHLPKYSIFTLKEDEVAEYTGGIAKLGMLNWQMPHSYLNEKMCGPLKNLALFLEDRKLNGYQRRLQKSLFTYSKGLSSFEVTERLTHAISALEHFLLKDANEPIQNSVGERLAFMIATNSNERQDVVSNFKAVYKIRSRHVHHLIAVEDEAVLQQFFLNCFRMMFQASANMNKFSEHQKFIAAVDQLKFS